MFGAMPTNHNGTCAAAFLFLDGSEALVFRERGIWLVFLSTRLLQATAVVSGSFGALAP